MTINPGNAPFLSQDGWAIRKGLRNGISVSRACSRFRHLPPELRSDPVQAPKIPGRNEPCPCGSGKKFKKCCDGD